MLWRVPISWLHSNHPSELLMNDAVQIDAEHVVRASCCVSGVADAQGIV